MQLAITPNPLVSNPSSKQLYSEPEPISSLPPLPSHCPSHSLSLPPPLIPQKGVAGDETSYLPASHMTMAMIGVVEVSPP